VIRTAAVGALLAVSLVVGVEASGASATHGRHGSPPGVGATLAAWKAAYGLSRGCDDNACFGPAWHHPGAGLRYQYGEVSYNKGRIGSYEEAFPPHTPVDVAERDILATLPGAVGGPITVVPGSASDDGCGQLNVASATVGKELGTYDPTGQVGIEFEYLPANGNTLYSASNVQLALVLATSDTPGSC